MSKPRIILFDLETLPEMSKVMKYFTGMSAYPGLTMKATHNTVICAGYKVLGDKKTSIINAWDYPARWKKNVNDDYAVIKAIADVLRDADAIVGHNSRRFDIKFLNTRLVYHGLPPIPKVPHIDTCQVAKSKLFLFNNRLNTVAEHLQCTLKLENGGWSLWERVMQRDKKAQDLMARYCKQDVDTLEEVFVKLRPFITILPNHNYYTDGTTVVCPNCGSSKLSRNGLRATKQGPVQRFRCLDCGTSSTKNKAEVV
jgi:DNA polymerase elongation subunit (family B)/predicted RNA-binding Zn-ribbon protein involved in translation (DUF1610 family)